MTLITLALLAATVNFIAILFVKKVIGVRVCAICAAVSLLWIAMLILYKFNISIDPILLALLMGQSVIGIYYLVEQHVPRQHHIFRLPFLLMLTLVAYAMVNTSIQLWQPLLYVAALWAVFGVIYMYRHSSKLAGTVDQIVACCKEW